MESAFTMLLGLLHSLLLLAKLASFRITIAQHSVDDVRHFHRMSLSISAYRLAFAVG
jgi:hypothetical protein